MFKMFATVDNHQCFKLFISQTTFIRLEHSSRNTEKLFASLSKLLTISSNWVTFSAVWFTFKLSASQHSIV